MLMEITIHPLHPDDWPAVREIYQAGIDTGWATFETAAPTAWETWSASKRPDCRLVARAADGSILGWAALSPTSTRPAYAGVCEVSIYIAAEARGRGVGSALMAALITASEQAGIWTLFSSIFPENEASYALHMRHGFRLIGRRERIAQRDGIWRDTLLLERRKP